MELCLPTIRFSTAFSSLRTRLRPPRLSRSTPAAFFPIGNLKTLGFCILITRSLKQHQKKPPRPIPLDISGRMATWEEVSAVEKNAYNEKLPAEEPKEESAANKESQMFEFLEKLDIKAFEAI